MDQFPIKSESFTEMYLVVERYVPPEHGPEQDRPGSKPVLVADNAPPRRGRAVVGKGCTNQKPIYTADPIS